MTKNTDQWDIVINSNSNSLFDNIRNLLKYVDLIKLLVTRDFKVFYKQTILGPIWYLIQPILNSGVFTLIFSGFANLSTDETPPYLFYMSGTIVWSYFAANMTNVSNIFISNKDLFSKVYFPRLAVPIANSIIQIFQFLLQFTLLAAVMFFFYLRGTSYEFDYTIIFIPLLLLKLSFISIGFGCLFASITYKYKDLSLLLSFATQLWMFITPVIYPLSIVKEKYVLLYCLNPVSAIIENFRIILFHSAEFNFVLTLLSSVLTIIIFIFGVSIFSKVERKFMDTI